MSRIGLIGNPNSGKTTLFNRLTGSTHHTGNWPGVTVDIRTGTVRQEPEIQLTDLPGLYSLNPNTPEQRVAGEFLRAGDMDLFVDVIDATNLERNLHLSLQLMETGVPLALAVNMMDEAERLGFMLDLPALSCALGVPVFPVSAVTGAGLPELVSFMKSAADAVSGFASESGKNGKGEAYDGSTGRKPALPWLVDVPEHDGTEESGVFNAEWDAAVTPARYAWIEVLTEKIQRRNDRGLIRTGRIDRILMHGVFGIPIFLGVMMLLFFLVFGAPGAALSGWAEALLGLVQNIVNELLRSSGAAEWLVRLVVEGIIGGVGSVLVFVPQFALLFFGLAVLEDSGYMSRAAFVMDRFMRRFGLSGKAFIPMLVGFGCNVPAIMATRALSSERERKLTVFLLPFMSCGARMPVYALLSAAFFGKAAGLVVFGLYVSGIAAAMLTGFLLRKTILKGAPTPFVMELPPYRMPTLRSLWAHLSERVGDYLKKAGTLIFAASVIVWFLQAFTPAFQLSVSPEQSLFAVLGRFIAPVFEPAGFGDWRISIALLTGFAAKEAVLSTLGVLLAGGGAGGMGPALQSLLQPASALSLMVFVLLYTPCMATLAAMHREFRSLRWTLGAVLWQLGFAWTAAFVVYQSGRLLLG